MIQPSTNSVIGFEKLNIWRFPIHEGTPKLSILIGFSFRNHSFCGTPVSRNIHICKWMIFRRHNEVYPANMGNVPKTMIHASPFNYFRPRDFGNFNQLKFMIGFPILEGTTHYLFFFLCVVHHH